MEQRDLSGILFKNSYKEEGSNQPDYRGNAKIDGQAYRVSAWVKEGKSGPFLSLAFSVEEDKPKSDDTASDEPKSRDGLPF